MRNDSGESIGRFAGLAGWLCAVCLATSCLIYCAPALAGNWEGLINRLAADGLDRGRVAAVLCSPEVRRDPGPMGAKLMEFYMAKYGSRLTALVQARLVELEYYFGPVDGRQNYLTKAAVKAYQGEHGLAPDGRVSLALLRSAQGETAKAPAGLGLRELAEPKVLVFASVLTPERLAEAREFYDSNLPLLRRVQADYGVSPEIMVGLLTVETRTGRFLGEDLAVNVLANMAVSASFASVAAAFPEERVTPEQAAALDAKAAEKSAWAYNELKALFVYAFADNIDLLKTPGSIYGAIGLCQFMPSSICRFGVDADAKGRIDLFNTADALCSLAYYLRCNGLTPGAGPAAQRKALYRYNHSRVYVNTILAVAAYLQGRPLP